MADLNITVEIRRTRKARILMRLGLLIRLLPMCLRLRAYHAIRRGTFVRTGGAEWCLADVARPVAPPSHDA